MSEIARIREQINREIEAMQHAQSYAAVAKHDIINCHYQALEDYYAQLTAHVGTKHAIEEVIKRLEEIL